ncbi:Ig-like domain-containing protein [Thermodesulfobacteriota bacterium]
MCIAAKKRGIFFIVVFAFLSCLLTLYAHDLLALGSHGGNSLKEIVKSYLPWHGKAHPTLKKPLLIVPEGKITTKRPLYQWQPVDGANRYGIVVFRMARPQIPVFIKFNIMKTQVRHSWFSRLRYDTDYFFVVIAYKIKKMKRAISPFSDRMYFRVVKNLPPLADDQHATINEDETGSIILTASDPDEDDLNYQVLTNPIHGILIGEAPVLTYTPDLNYNGSDSFTFKANDGIEDSNIAAVTLTVRSVNDSPAAEDDTIATVAEAPIIVAFSSLLGNDTDVEGSTLTIAGFTQPANGTVTDNGDNTFTYTPNPDFIGSDSFTYTVSDGNGGTDTAIVSVTVNYPLPIVSINAFYENIPVGGSTTLSWSSAYADSVSINQGIGDVDLTGTTTVSPTDTTIYTITATGPGGSSTDTVTVTTLNIPADTDYGLDAGEQQGAGGLVGETVRILNGNTIESRFDLGFPSTNRLGLALQAFYNSRSDALGSMGHGWTHTYEASLDPFFDISGVTVLRIIDSKGRGHYFMEEEAGAYSGIFAERTHVRVEAGQYVWHRLDGSRYIFSGSGMLNFIDDATGNRLQIAYAPGDRPRTVTDNGNGRTLIFNYNGNGLLDHISGPVTAAVIDGVWVTYIYDANQNLTSVNFADGSGFNYAYTDSNDSHNLTEKRDKLSHLLNTWDYDSQDRAVTNFSRDGKGVNIVYETLIQVNVTDAYEKEREYFLTEMAGRKRVSSIINGPGGAGGFPWSAGNAVSWIYDENMNPLEIEYAGGTINRYLDYDSRGNPGTVKLSFGTLEERVIHYTYHPDVNTPLSRTKISILGNGNKETIWDYDNDYDAIPNEEPSGLLTRIIERGYTKEASTTVINYEYITIFTYNSKGQVLTIDGPLPDNGDTTTFTYDPITGDLLSITRPIIGSTSFTGYDAAGQVGMLIDVNGHSKSFTYDAKGRVTVITNNADGSSRCVDYNMADLPEIRTDEDGVESRFEYDPIYGRLLKRFDHEGNYIAYSYDLQGNVIEKGHFDSTDTRTNRKHFQYQDPAHVMPGKLYKEINADDTFTQYGYDLDGNVASVTDTNGNITTYGYDSMKRLVTVTQPGAVVTSYTYDGHGNLATVTDAELHETIYEYDDMGRLVSAESPDTGTVTYLYNEAGNPIKKGDAKGITVEYLYDTLNRLTDVIFPDSAQDITYSYDSGSNGLGRRTGMNDESGSMTFGYDNRGRLMNKSSVINGITYDLSRTHTQGGRVSSITFPTGRTVDYHRAACACGVGSITTNYGGNTSILMQNLTYRPFGGASGMSTGAGGTVGSRFDESGRLTIANPGADKEITYGYDNNGNLTSINAPATPWHNRTYTYDALNRLDHAEGLWEVIDFTYDAVGNRLAKIEDGSVDTYAYIIGTNILDTITGTDTTIYTHDANGKVTGIGDKELIYNQNHRLIRVDEDSAILGEYSYNGLGQRVVKEAGGISTVFHYDFDGNIIGESDLSGDFSKEYLYRGKGRLALVDVSSGEVYYFGNDRLGTPQILTDSTNTVVWEGVYKPFGEAEINPNSTVANNFRFPGQYYDNETGLHYNYHRYYDPKTGRYLRADPIGLAGGINPFVYVGDNPVNDVDPNGLLSADYHAGITLMASLRSKKGLMDNLKLAWQTAVVDFSESSQEKDIKATRQHAMSGLLPDGTYQMSAEAIEATEEFIKESIKSGNIANAIHAVQDLFTPRHAGQEWRGLDFDLESALHILGDIFPSWDTIKKAYQNTKQILSDCE